MNIRVLPRGVFERPPGSGKFWVRYQDADGNERREKVGPLKAAAQLVEKRRTEVRQRVKLPENFRARPVAFRDLAKAALEYSKGNNPLSHSVDKSRMVKIEEKFGDWLAEKITPQDIQQWLASHDEWADATKNRYLALIKLSFRLAETNGKINANPARLVRMRRENNARVRYLGQYAPPETKVEYLKPHKDEESRLRAVIEREFPRHMPELDIALNTGLRRGEQYGLQWPDINLERKLLTIRRSKHGETRHVPLNPVALSAFKKLLPGMESSNCVFLSARKRKGGRKALRGPRHWFEDAVTEAGLQSFHWHDLRHSFASRLVMAGVDLRTVQELMGHKTITMTVRYSHLAPAHTLAAVERLAAYDATAKKSAKTVPVRVKNLRKVG